MPSGWGNRLINNPLKIVCLSALKREIQIDEVGHEKVPVCQRIREGLLIKGEIQTQFWNDKNSSGKGEGTLLEEVCLRQREEYHIGKYWDECVGELKEIRYSWIIELEFGEGENKWEKRYNSARCGKPRLDMLRTWISAAQMKWRDPQVL